MIRKSNIYKAVILLFIVVFIGVSGYMVLGNATIVDALYMTIITMTTVGFGEIHTFSASEKIFTIFLILISITAYGILVKVVSEYIASGDFFNQIKNKKMQQKISKLKNHTVVCGYGRNGVQAVAKLTSYDKPCLVIERDSEMITQLEQEGILYLQGDATNDATLIDANIANASSLITALPSDADNLFVVLSAKQLNTKLTIISRASNQSSCSKLKIAGANNVIMPDKLGGDHMASLVVTPDVIEFVDQLSLGGEVTTNLKEIAVNDLPKEYINKTLLDLDLRRKTGCTIIGFKTTENEYIINPEADTTLEVDTNLIVIGRPEQIKKLHSLFL